MGHIAELSIPDRLEAIIDNPDWLHSFRHDARVTLNQTGHLPQKDIWDYLHRRRDLAPARFDHWHPEFRKLFRDEARHHPTMPIVPLPVAPIVIRPPDHPTPSGAVPEPSSAILLGPAMLILAVWARLRGR